MTGHLGFRLALPFAVFLGIAEVVRNWGDWGFWPFWVVDYIAAGLLAWAWQTARHRRPPALTRLAGAWGFTCAMFYMSFFGHVAEIQNPDHGPIDQRSLTLIIGILFGVTVLGFASTLKARHIEPSPTSGTRGGAEASSE